MRITIDIRQKTSLAKLALVCRLHKGVKDSTAEHNAGLSFFRDLKESFDGSELVAFTPDHFEIRYGAEAVRRGRRHA